MPNYFSCYSSKTLSSINHVLFTKMRVSCRHIVCL